MKQKCHTKAHELFAQALDQEIAAPDTIRQLSLLKAWGDSQVLNGDYAEAADLYERALAVQPDCVETIVVSLCMPEALFLAFSVFTHPACPSSCMPQLLPARACFLNQQASLQMHYHQTHAQVVNVSCKEHCLQFPAVQESE